MKQNVLSLWINLAASISLLSAFIIAGKATARHFMFHTCLQCRVFALQYLLGEMVASAAGGGGGDGDDGGDNDGFAVGIHICWWQCAHTCKLSCVINLTHLLVICCFLVSTEWHTWKVDLKFSVSLRRSYDAAPQMSDERIWDKPATQNHALCLSYPWEWPQIGGRCVLICLYFRRLPLGLNTLVLDESGLTT